MPTTPRPSQLARRALDRRAFLRMAGLAGLGAAGAGSLAACGGSDSSSSSSGGSADFGDIAVQLSWIKNIEFAGEYMADSKGYYTDAGFSKVALTAGGQGATAAESAVATGKAFCGLSSPLPTATAIQKGGELVTVGATYQKNSFCIVGKEATGITSPQALEGKRIGVQSGVNETIFNAMLKANDIDPGSMTIVPVQFDPTVVATGEVDGFMAYITNEPILLAAQGVPTSSFLFADHGLPLVNETFIVARSALEDDRDKLKAFLLAEVRGWTDALNDPSGAAELTVTDERYGKSQKLDLDDQTQEIDAQAQLIVSADTQANGIFTITDQLVQQNLASLANAGITIDADDLFDLSPLMEVYQENPDLVSAVTLAPTAS